MGRRAVICPICLGKGRIPNPYGTTVAEIPCHGCGGLGWIQIGDDNIINECPIMKGWLFPVFNGWASCDQQLSYPHMMLTSIHRVPTYGAKF